MPQPSLCNPTVFALQLRFLSPELQQHFPAPLGQDFPFCSHSLAPGNPSVVVIVGFPKAWLWPPWELHLPLPGCGFWVALVSPRRRLHKAPWACSTTPEHGTRYRQHDEQRTEGALRSWWKPDSSQLYWVWLGWAFVHRSSMVLWFGFATKPALTRHQYFGYCWARLSLFLHSAHHQWVDVHLHLWLLTGELHCPQTCLNILHANSPAVPSTYLKQNMHKIQSKHCSLFKSYRSNTTLAFSFFLCTSIHIFFSKLSIFWHYTFCLLHLVR